MLSENIKQFRKERGLSQQELAVKLNVVRQTVSKWENGLSVPDSTMLILLAEEFGIPVSKLLGEKLEEKSTDDVKVISEKLEVINQQLANQTQRRKKAIHWFLISLALLILVTFIGLIFFQSAYLG